MKKELIFSVHQPNFIPWLGFFDKIAKSDVFVVLDEVFIPRGTSVANKNKILTHNGILDLTLPISHPKGNNRLTSYKEVNFVDEKSKFKILKTIQSSYCKTQYFEEVYFFIENIFHANTFCELNINFIEELCKRFNINTKIKLLSELEIDGTKNELIVEIGKKVESTIYLSGIGAKAYNDVDFFNTNNINIIYQEYQPHNYLQYHSKTFIEKLSVVDYLFNQGFQSPF
jgi:hypothetical protein